MKITDQLLFEAITSGNKQQRDWAIYQFYADVQLKGSIINYVKNHGGNQEDGEDVFQEAICIFDRNIREGKYNHQSTLKTYLFAIAKWHWVTYNRKYKKSSELKADQIQGQVESVDVRILEEERKELINKAVEQLDERCKELLGYYKLDYSMKEITSLLKFSSPAMAKKQAYRCRERLRKVFLDHPALLKALNIEIGND